VKLKLASPAEILAWARVHWRLEPIRGVKEVSVPPQDGGDG
jgi:hypothetical protein